MKKVFLLTISLCIQCLLSAQTIYYVSSTNGNDANSGTSAGSSFKTLKQALYLMNTNSLINDITIYVEKGTYYPATETDPQPGAGTGRDATFLVNNVTGTLKRKILGGYDFNSMTRDPINNPTILDGQGNVNHVMTIIDIGSSAEFELSGFTISNGNGTLERGSFNYPTNSLFVSGKMIPRNEGAGIFIGDAVSTKAKITNCIIRDNHAYVGAGMAMYQSQVDIINCIFDGNRAKKTTPSEQAYPNDGRGGAIFYNNFNQSFTHKVYGSVFYGNKGVASAAIQYSAAGASGKLLILSSNFVHNGNYFDTPSQLFGDYYLIEKESGGSLEMANSIIWNNNNKAGSYDRNLNQSFALLNLAGTVSLIHVFIQHLGDVNNSYTTTYISVEDPQFLDQNNPLGSDGKWMTGDDGLQLKPCGRNTINGIEGMINSAETTYVALLPSIDLFGNKLDLTGRNRKVENLADIGAYETQMSYLSWPDNDGDGYGANIIDQFATRSYCPTPPSGNVTNHSDCDDFNATVYPNAPELCENIDNDCDGVVDDGLIKTRYYRDADIDGYGNPNIFKDTCDLPTGYVSNSADCNDGNASIKPGATEICNGIDDDCDGFRDEGIAIWYRDFDGDGDGDPNVTKDTCAKPNGYVNNLRDCDDHDKFTCTTCLEFCNGKDDNCDGIIDDVPRTTYYKDNDGDLFGDPSIRIDSCRQPAGYVLEGTDCNDNDASIHPNLKESCNGIDDNCNGTIDEGLAVTWYRDADGDGFGDAMNTILSCPQPMGYVSNNSDCDDTSSSINPNGTEVCNGKDDDCNTAIDEGLAITWYQDADGDGYGNLAITKDSCSIPSGYVSNNTDCNDASNAIYPGAQESCNGMDDDCDQSIDEALASKWYRDADGDGFGDINQSKDSCAPPVGYVGNTSDCNDQSSSIKPTGIEICNGTDDNCDGQIDNGLSLTWYRDQDLDGFGNINLAKDSCAQPLGYVSNHTDCNDSDNTIKPTGLEVCNGVDDDCNTIPDDVAIITWYRDSDGDGFGDINNTKDSCGKPAGYVSNQSDCNDLNNTINPNGKDTLCNGIDEDCDGQFDEDFISARCIICQNGALKNAITLTSITGLALKSVTTNSAIVYWKKNPVAESYTVEYKAATTGAAWTLAGNTLDTFMAINGLVQNQVYDWRVKGKCGAEFSPYSLASFNTQIQPCAEAPSNLKASQITYNSAFISWVAPPLATNFTIQVYNANTVQWITVITTNQTSYLWSNLIPKTSYKWRIWATCGSVSSSIVQSEFKTISAPDPECPGTESYEPNNSTAQAKPIPFNTIVKGKIKQSGDVDYFKFTIKQKGAIKATMTNLPADFDLYIYSSSGALAATSKKWMTLDESVQVTLSAGDYFVKIVAFNGAFNADDCYSLMIELITASVQSLEPRSNAFDVAAFPNPVKDKLNIKIMSSGNSFSHIIVVDVNGKVLQKIKTFSDLNQIDLSNFVSGTYFLKIMNDTQYKNIIILKE